jgi:MFS family permease
MFVVLAFCGFSMSLQFTAYNTVAYDDIPSGRAAAANSFYSTFQQLMLSFGICTGALALTASRMVGDRLHPTIGDFSTAFLAVTVISLIAAPVCLGFPINAGAAMSGQRRKIENIEINAAT